MKHIAAGYDFSLAVREDGYVYSWGRNFYGQLGDGSTTDALLPVTVGLPPDPDTSPPGGPKIIAVAAGREHALALNSSGQVFAWGSNNSGELGLGFSDALTHPTPTLVPLPSSDVFTGIAAGQQSSFALRNDGKIFAWGYNVSGQLGDLTYFDRTSPVAVDDNPANVYTFVGAGQVFTLAVRDDGTGWAWGENGEGNRCNGIDQLPMAPEPVQMSINGTGPRPVVSLCGGISHGIGLRSNGDVISWGRNEINGLLGDGLCAIFGFTAVDVPGIAGAVSVAAGYNHSLVALGGTGEVRSWGTNGDGQLGLGFPGGPSPLPCLGTMDSNAFDTPQQVLMLDPPPNPPATIPLVGIVSVAAAQSHSVALDGSGRVFAWGNNLVGQLGQGDTGQRTIATLIAAIDPADPNADLVPDDQGNNLMAVKSADDASAILDWTGVPPPPPPASTGFWRLFADDTKASIGLTPLAPNVMTWKVFTHLNAVANQAPMLLFYSLKGLSVCTFSPGP